MKIVSTTSEQARRAYNLYRFSIKSRRKFRLKIARRK